MSQPENNEENNDAKSDVEETEKQVTKQSMRKQVWEYLERNGLSSFPRPVYGRIPNFKGCEEAAAKLLDLDEFKNSKCIEVNPDKPQEAARILVLKDQKNLYVPVPRLKEGLLKHIIVPEDGNSSAIKQSVSRKGIEENGKTIGVDDKIHVDLLVLGSVAVSRNGYRIGKGRGYADLEYAILREMKTIDDSTVVVTTVHESQVFDTLPSHLFQPYDVPVDYILTPKEIIKVEHCLPRPSGIIWNLLSQRRVNLMPVLQSLKELDEGRGKDTTLKEVDSDIEIREPRKFNNGNYRRFKRSRPRSLAKTSESQGEGNSEENAKPFPRPGRYFRRRPLRRSEETPNENGESGTTGGEYDQSAPPKPRYRQYVKPYRKRKAQIDFSVMISNIEKTVRVRDLKNALNEHGIKPNDITWRGYKGYCCLHYAKPAAKATAVPQQVDNVIEILQNMKISPDSEVNLSVKVVEPISRIETTDVTAV